MREEWANGIGSSSPSGAAGSLAAAGRGTNADRGVEFTEFYWVGASAEYAAVNIEGVRDDEMTGVGKFLNGNGSMNTPLVTSFMDERDRDVGDYVTSGKSSNRLPRTDSTKGNADITTAARISLCAARRAALRSSSLWWCTSGGATSCWRIA